MTRGYYGELTGDDANEGRAILSLALKNGQLPHEYCDVDQKHRGSALNYSIYDVTKNTVIVQQRETTCDKYGNHPKKTYYRIDRKRINSKTAVVQKIDSWKPRIVKLAKTVDEVGDIIAVINGSKQIKIKTSASSSKIAYKQVAAVGGKFYSIYDGETEYIPGKRMTQRAADDHGGGYYVYNSIHKAQDAVFPLGSRYYFEKKVILKCQVSGHSVEYSNGKTAYTNLTPIEVVSPVVPAQATPSALNAVLSRGDLVVPWQ
jgi:hypothetical protein